MELFDKKYVHFMWDNELEGKEGFFSDNIHYLQSYVESNKTEMFGKVIRKSFKNGFPFIVGDSDEEYYRFFYYDPHYDCKRAYSEGKIIQYELDGEWFDLDSADNPNWDSGYNFRIKPVTPEKSKIRRMTYRELAEWLAKGFGQVSYTDRSIATKVCVETYNSYFEDFDNTEVPNDYKIRYWGSDEWIEPTVDVYEADCNKE